MAGGGGWIKQSLAEEPNLHLSLCKRVSISWLNESWPSLTEHRARWLSTWDGRPSGHIAYAVDEKSLNGSHATAD
jgi:hypothetical protein